MEIIIKPENREVSLERAKTVAELLEKLKYKKEEVLVIDINSGKLLPAWEKLSGSEKIEIRKVISGG